MRIMPGQNGALFLFASGKLIFTNGTVSIYYPARIKTYDISGYSIFISMVKVL